MSHLLLNVLPEPRRKLIFVYPDVKISQCCELMSQHDIGALLVTDEDNVVGLLTERDIVRRVMCQGLNPNTSKASDIAFADVTILSFHDSVETAMQIMTETKRRHVLIEEKGQIVSIISIGDLMYHILEEKMHTIDQLEKYINNYY